MKSTLNLNDRLVRFAGEAIFFASTIDSSSAADYYNHQLIRSSDRSAKFYSKAQSMKVRKPFRQQMTRVLEALRVSKTTLKIMRYASFGDQKKLTWLLEEVEKLIAMGKSVRKGGTG